MTAEHKRLIELYSPKDATGKPLPLASADDLTDKPAFERDYDALIGDTFEVEGIPAALFDGMSLAGATWVGNGLWWKTRRRLKTTLASETQTARRAGR